MPKTPHCAVFRFVGGKEAIERVKKRIAAWI
jgi:hypothetical protein